MNMNEAHPEGYETSLNETRVYISRAFQAGENPVHVPAAGNILTRLCVTEKLGKAAWDELKAAACRQCVYFETYTEDDADAKICAERNLLGVLRDAKIEPDDFLRVSATASNVGFFDEIEANNVTVNQFGGYREIAGYNAYFARKHEVKAMGSALADCGYVAVEFDLPDGDLGYGFIHITKDNMEGIGSETHWDGKQKQSFVAFSLSEAGRHYGVPVETMRVKLTAATDKLIYTFAPNEKKGWETAEEAMDGNFPGWFDMGLLHNTSNPGWKRGDPIELTDSWDADYHGMCQHLLITSGVNPENIDMTEIVNPRVLETGHASNAAGAHGKRPDARDLYLVSVK